MTGFDPLKKRVAVFADSASGRETVLALAERMGARVIAEATPSTAAAVLEDGLVGDALLVDLEHDTGAALDVLLDALDALAHARQLPMIVNAGPDVIDVVAARLSAPGIALMSKASPADWVSAIAMLGTVRPSMVRDATSDESLRLQRLADEVSRIARALADLAATEPGAAGVNDAPTSFRGSADPVSPHQGPVTAADVRTIIRLRRLRDRFFTGDLFADPAWDMLLDLMAASLDGERVAVSSLCIAAAVPPTTALRWIKTMTDNGLFVRVSDPEDGRRIFIELSDQAAASMTAYLRAAKLNGETPI